MSYNDVVRVNARIIGLYLSPGQFITVAPPSGVCGMGIKEIRIWAGLPVRFEYERNGTLFRNWLSLNSERPPRWNFQMMSMAQPHEETEIDWTEDFTDLRVLPSALLLKAYCDHFPFVATNNYFLNNGECVA